ncbi:mitochondrial carrier [Metschnikowia bicuspidata var. bicuspidata NRRL YB-4993]|uniref:Mitochondrial carrier n=1 Tax=Metschnikowia bicuspidata var. bicuspidata NRRL YB-4993 TaxID=869754 RepID=A0A1A0HJ73_9ASCO|nr:mitochondrial carrier [Metschnikowia bicuspidata var. bicuspidata NRRL YB-4993]OBA24065.1 mitochondrial carrier [Metschnikowia bicuspidata var. bicuspidata NRRL YB-4993]
MALTPLEKAASGALASAIANTLVYPLDLSKTIIQTQVKKHDSMLPSSSVEGDIMSASTGDDSVLVSRKKNALKYKNTVDVLQKIHAKKGVLGWYHGLFSSILGSAAQNFSYFYWYSVVRQAYALLTKTAATRKHLTVLELFLGALAAAISQLFTMPIGVITTQQQTDKEHRSLYQLAREIYVHDGVHGFWKGLKVSLVLCINPSITYGSYERLKQIFFENKEFLGPLESFSLGMCAKSLATLSTQPLIVSKAMLQKKVAKKTAAKDSGSVETETPDHDDDIHFNSFVEALAHLWQTEKIRGLYKGVAPQLLKGVIVQGMLFMFKDQLDLLFLAFLRMLKARKKLRIV